MLSGAPHLLGKTVLQALEDQGVEITPLGLMMWCPQTQSYQLPVMTRTYIQPHHLHNVECALGAYFGSVRLICNEQGWAEAIIIDTRSKEKGGNDEQNA